MTLDLDSNSSRSLMALLLTIILFLTGLASSSGGPTIAFKPADNILIDCGAKSSAKTPEGRVFKSDSETVQFIEAKDHIQISAPPSDKLPSPLYLTARIFRQEAIYKFHMTQPGWHWVRLHFFAFPNDKFDLQQATFSVLTEKYVLIHNFKLSNNNNNDSQTVLQKEYLVNITDAQFSLRVNVGGPLITPQNDTLGRTWTPDKEYLKDENFAKDVKTTSSATIKYPPGVTPLIAPQTVYATAAEMADSHTMDPNFNVTWNFPSNPSFHYLIRLHFCDIISKSLNDLYFNVYINGKTAISGLDLSTLAGGLSSPYYKDIVVNSTLMKPELQVQIGPLGEDTGTKNAILNGVEVMKMSNSVDSLDGEFGVDGRTTGAGRHGMVATAGFVMMFGAFVGLGAMVYKWKKRPQDWQKRNSFSSWLLPMHSGDTTFSSSHKSNLYNTTLGLGRSFSFSELQEVTKNFDASEIIGVGGFGNVYIGTIDDGTQVAIKRDPEYFRRQQLTDKSDVYSFGVVLLEALCARPAINPQLPREQVNLAEWAMQWKQKGLLEKIIDPHLVGSVCPESMKKFAEAAEKCFAEYGVDRPSMGDVLWNLEYALQLQEAFSQGKTESEEVETGKTVAATVAAPPVSSAATTSEGPVSQTGEKDDSAVDQHSGTTRFTQFASLNGR
ncbi:hypothetical protein HID58_061960 [Brassica napus]|uniref:Malectin-like domain-containing protein n=1 Tax=Brassica napus TaxID=3708 RepID=A0ABQ8A061_BRANA|nr:hypothetical protein HID58_061960 [Brassica napus]